MKSHRNNRVAAIGMAGALALGAVASVGAVTPAGALDTQYNCTTSLSATPLPFGVTTANPLAGPFVAGQQVPAQPVSLNVLIPGALLDLIRLGFPSLTSLSGTIADAPLTVGSQQVTMTGLAAPSTPLPAMGTGITLPIAGSTAPFTAPAPGSYPINLPGTFNFQPSFLPPPPVPCALNSGSSSTVGTMTVVKDSSKTTARLKNGPIDTSDHAKIATKVLTGSGNPAVGKVVAKEAGKTLAKGTLDEFGKKKLRLPLLSKGFHKIVVKYKGNSTTEASKKAVKFTVTK